MRTLIILVVVLVASCGKPSYPMYPVKTVDMQQRMYQHYSQIRWEEENMNKEKIDAFRANHPEKTMYQPNLNH